MTEHAIRDYLTSCFPGLPPESIPAGMPYRRGKVRDILDLGRELLMFTTDRISAFDHVLGLVPFKAEVLNRVSTFWFKRTESIIRNHIIEEIGPRSIRVVKAKPLPVEVIVRGYLTGSAWRDYQAGKPISGISLPAGMRFNQAFDTPLITPSTKAEQGEHDAPLSRGEILSSGLVPKALWEEVETVTMALFDAGSRHAADQGLILVDTKYEFGLVDGALCLIDELHTPDSSRFWFSAGYQDRFESGAKQAKLDKEYLRQWLMDQGFTGNGKPPDIPDEVYIETAKRYIQAFELITGDKFTPSSVSIEAETEKILSYLAQG